MKNTSCLCVDLDGTLIYNDLVQESIVFLLRKNIFYVFLFPGWLLKGFAYFKQAVAKRIDFDPSILPYNQAMIDYVLAQRHLGRKTVLVTASDQRIAEKIANYLNIFDEVIGSDGVKSYAGAEKLKKMQATYGMSGFDYAGNSPVDLAIWPGCYRDIVIVTNSRSLLEKAKKMNKKIVHFPSLKKKLGDFFKFMHVFRWRRNILIFVPLIIAKQYDWQAWWVLIPAFLIFSLCTSSMAILSDLFDLEVDRKHPKKKHRPLPAGKISARAAVLFSLFLFLLSVGLGLFYTPAFSRVIIYYALMSLLYIILLKRFFPLRMVGLLVLSLMPIFAGISLKMH